MRFSFVARMLMASLVHATALLWSIWATPPTSSASLVAQQDCSNLGAFPTGFSFPSGGGSDTINIFNAQGCSWTVTSHDAFISVTNVNQQDGSGYVNFSVPAYSGPSRVGTITIDAGLYTKTIQVSQQGSAPFSLYRYWN